MEDEIWSNEDPRHTVCKHKTIIVFNKALRTCTTAEVETKHSYSIWFDNKEEFHLSYDDKWNQDYYWAYAP